MWAFLCLEEDHAMAIRPFRVPLHLTITVRLDHELLHKIDEMAMTLNRSRTDMVRQILAHSTLTGLPDVAASIPMTAAGAGDGD
jgi:hypothetical protein